MSHVSAVMFSASATPGSVERSDCVKPSIDVNTAFAVYVSERASPCLVFFPSPESSKRPSIRGGWPVVTASISPLLGQQRQWGLGIWSGGWVWAGAVGLDTGRGPPTHPFHFSVVHPEWATGHLVMCYYCSSNMLPVIIGKEHETDPWRREWEGSTQTGHDKSACLAALQCFVVVVVVVSPPPFFTFVFDKKDFYESIQPQQCFYFVRIIPTLISFHFLVVCVFSCTSLCESTHSHCSLDLSAAWVIPDQICFTSLLFCTHSDPAQGMQLNTSYLFRSHTLFFMFFLFLILCKRNIFSHQTISEPLWDCVIGLRRPSACRAGPPLQSFRTANTGLDVILTRMLGCGL